MNKECLYLLKQCSAQVFKRAGCHLKRAHLVRWADRQKGTISAVNWRKGHNYSPVNRRRALLTKNAVEWHNKRGTAQSTLCVGNKNGKTELKARWLIFFKKMGFFSQKGRASFQLFKKGRGVTKKRQGAAPCKNGLGRTLLVLKWTWRLPNYACVLAELGFLLFLALQKVSVNIALHLIHWSMVLI